MEKKKKKNSPVGFPPPRNWPELMAERKNRLQNPFF
jgi:hypothetical protein